MPIEDFDEELLNSGEIPKFSPPKRINYELKAVFEPTDRDMKIEYPELADMPEFSNMPNADIKFCWYFGCKSSPHFSDDDSDSERLFKCVREAYGNDFTANKAAVAILKGDFSADIIAGINRMKIFSPMLRSRGDAMLNKILDNFEKMINISDSDISLMGIPEKKAFIGLSVEVARELPNVIHQLEGGFSVSKAQFKKGIKAGQSSSQSSKEDTNLMDSIVSNHHDANPDEEIF